MVGHHRFAGYRLVDADFASSRSARVWSVERGRRSRALPLDNRMAKPWTEHASQISARTKRVVRDGLVVL